MWCGADARWQLCPYLRARLGGDRMEQSGVGWGGQMRVDGQGTVKMGLECLSYLKGTQELER